MNADERVKAEIVRTHVVDDDKVRVLVRIEKPNGSHVHAVVEVNGYDVSARGVAYNYLVPGGMFASPR